MIDPNLLSLCFRIEAIINSPTFIAALAFLGVIAIGWFLLARREPF